MKNSLLILLRRQLFGWKMGCALSSENHLPKAGPPNDDNVVERKCSGSKRVSFSESFSKATTSKLAEDSSVADATGQHSRPLSSKAGALEPYSEASRNDLMPLSDDGRDASVTRPQTPTKDDIHKASMSIGSSEAGASSVSHCHGLPMRGSQDSTGSTSAANSNRSSFAKERRSLDNERSSMDSQQGTCAVRLPLPKGGISQDLKPYYAALAMMQPDVPIPLSALQMLWGAPNTAAAMDISARLQALGALKTATLDDGSPWCLASLQHLGHLQASTDPAALAALHGRLVDAYCAAAGGSLADIPEDGYIGRWLGQHLMAAGRDAQLLGLLLDPAWLERQLASQGVAAVVADFRRYLGGNDDPQVKLVMQAFQGACSCCQEFPGVPMLGPQMVGRLVAAAPGVGLGEWHTAQRERWCALAAANLQQSPVTSGGATSGFSVASLVPRTGSLVQAGSLARQTLRGHTGPVRAVLISSNGQEVLTASEDGSIQVWDMDAGDCSLQLAWDREPITALALAPDGNSCASATDSGEIHLWDLRSGCLLHTLRGHTARVNSLAIGPLGCLMVSSSADGTARVWRLEDGECGAVLEGHGGAIQLGVGDVLDADISFDDALVVTASDDLSVRVWDASTGRCLQVLEGHSGWVVCVRFMPNKHTVVSGSHDGTARIWDPAADACLALLEGHSGRINKVVVSDSGRFIATSSDDGTARVWEANGGRCVHTLAGHSAWVSNAMFARDDSVVVTVSGDGLGLVWSMDSGACERVLEGHSEEVLAVALTRKGRFAVTASADCTARVWDLKAPQLPPPNTHQGRVRSIVPVPGHQQVLSIGEDCTLRRWDVDSGTCLNSVTAHKAALNWLTMAMDGSVAVTASGDHQVCRWDVEAWQSAGGVPALAGSRVKSVAVDAAGDTAAIVLFDSTCSVWDLRSGTCKSQLIRRAERDGVRVHSGGVNGVLLSKDGAWAVTYSKDCTARMWTVVGADCTAVLAGHTDSVATAALSHSERLLATGSFDFTVRVWDTATCTCCAVLPHTGPVNDLTFSPNGMWLATLGEDVFARVWRVADRCLMTTGVGHHEHLAGVTFTPDSRFLVTWAQDCTVQVWEAASGQLRAFFMADAAITSLAVAGSTLVAGDASGLMHFLSFPAPPC